MLFNSYEFIFFFLPVVVGMYAAVSRVAGSRACLAWLATASLFFYGWWNPRYLLLLGGSLVFNFLCGRLLVRIRDRSALSTRLLLALGVTVNLALIGYFKYGGFAVQITNDVLHSQYHWTAVALPLAISFFTFQQIAYLVDTSAGRIGRVSGLDYLLFVTFFPQLIAGPIVHHEEMMPQFKNSHGAISRRDIEIGITLFTLGLAKKVLLADNIAAYVSPIYSEASSGSVTFLQAWIAGIGFTLQVYFDFSGYSEMALGSARLFGIRLPVNFNSPLKAPNIIDFWSRWHITLTRFLTAYIFTPMSMSATRKVMRSKGRLAGRKGLRKRFRGFASTLAIPALVTMFASGVWHGAGYPFLIFGLLHGVYLVINHAWRLLRPAIWKDSQSYDRLAFPIGVAMTLVCVAFAILFFRSENMTAANNLAVAFLGLNGITVPEGIHVHLSPLHPLFEALGIGIDTTSGSAMTGGVIACMAGLLFVLLLPNTLDLLRQQDPAIGYKTILRTTDGEPERHFRRPARWLWIPSRGWAVGIGALLALALMSLQRVSVFLYWQF